MKLINVLLLLILLLVLTLGLTQIWYLGQVIAKPGCKVIMITPEPRTIQRRI